MNSRRMNRLEELGRVDAEKAKTRMGKRNLRQEKSRIVRELKADGGKVKKRKKAGPKTGRPAPSQQRRMGSGAEGSKKPRVIKSSPEIILLSAQKEGPAKKYTTIKQIPMNFKKGGRALKPVKPSQRGLSKLPTKVRNKMGYMKKGGRVGMGKAMRGGGCVR